METNYKEVYKTDSKIKGSRHIQICTPYMFNKAKYVCIYEIYDL